MTDPLLQLVTRAVFVIVCALTIWDLIRWRDIQHLEVAALFGGLTLLIANQTIGDLTHLSVPEWLSIASVIGLLAQPYLLLRVLAQFREVSRLQHAIALVAFVLSSAVFVAYASTLPAWATLAIVLAFVYVEAYATFGFLQCASTHRGITQWRLTAIAVGSGCLAAAIIVAGAGSALGAGSRSLTQAVLDVFSLGSALGYYIGMAPPRWLRHVWQGSEVHRFLVAVRIVG